MSVTSTPNPQANKCVGKTSYPSYEEAKSAKDSLLGTGMYTKVKVIAKKGSYTVAVFKAL